MCIVVNAEEQEQKMENLKYVQNAKGAELLCKMYKWDLCKCKCKLIVTNVEVKVRQWQQSVHTAKAIV